MFLSKIIKPDKLAKEKRMKEFFKNIFLLVLVAAGFLFFTNFGWTIKWDTLGQIGVRPVTYDRSLLHRWAIDAHNEKYPNLKVIVLDGPITEEDLDYLRQQNENWRKTILDRELDDKKLPR